MDNVNNVDNVGKYNSKQQNYPVENLNNGCGAYIDINIRSPLYQTDNFPSTMSEREMAKKPLVSYTDAKGFQYRPPEVGRVISRDEIINKIVPYWELFISNVGLFGYHIVSSAARNIGTDDAMNILFFKGCNSEHAQSNLDVCATSILSWSLIGGALLYLAFASILAFILLLECKRHGYPATFTSLWNSPWFLVCYFFNEKDRIDLLTIPNKFVGFRKWTRLHIHRLILAAYSFMTTVIIIYYLSTKRTVDQDDLNVQKYKSVYKELYNQFYLPYYAAMYFYIKTILSCVIEIKASSNYNKPELVGINYASLKIH